MKTKDLRQGDVFHFPYLWHWQFEKGLQDSKSRTSCLAFKSKSPHGNIFLIIISISDKSTSPSNDVPIPRNEKKNAGLDLDRPAFVHVGEYNYDPLEGSFVMPPKPKVSGRFSRSFLEVITNALAQNMKSKSAVGIDRRK